MNLTPSEIAIRQFLFTLGFRSSYKGYHYLLAGLKLCSEDQSYIYNISGKLLPALSARFHTSSNSIRQAVLRLFSSSGADCAGRLRQMLADQSLPPDKLNFNRFILFACHQLGLIQR